MSNKTIYVRGGQPCQHSSGGSGVVLGLVALAGFGALYDKTHKTAHPAPKPPAPAPQPKVITITHQVTRVVHDHPFLSGWQLVIICAILAAMVVGGIHLARHLR